VFKKIFLVLIVLFVLAQFVPKSVFPLTNPPVNPADTVEARVHTLTPQVAAILHRSCYDCHSYRTVWPWYSKVAPVSWLLSNDVSEGRRHVNFSDWAQYTPQRAAAKLRNICDQVEEGDMPLWYYRPMHPNTKLSAADRSAICAWTRTASQAVTAEQPSAGQ
jgi:cytochrome c551/c552